MRVERASKPEKKNPDSHESGAVSFGVIYVNEVARRAFLDEKKPRFPVGSIIVREKLAKEDDRTPQLLVALVKHQSGFNALANDWEFLVLDSQASAIQRSEKTGSCQACHAQQKKTDFVFRTYLPEEVLRQQH
jgi:hypothetical protein